MTLEPWQELSRETLVHYKVFEVIKARRRSPRTGAEIGFFVIDTPRWVNVVALTDDDELLMVRQFRHGTEHVSLEIPGGLVDPHERDPIEAARRELREETGYEAREVAPLGVMTPNPAIFTNRCYTYLATGCRPVGALQQDPGEDLELVRIPRRELTAEIRRGAIDHALVLAALAFWWAAEAGAGHSSGDRTGSE